MFLSKNKKNNLNSRTCMRFCNCDCVFLFNILSAYVCVNRFFFFFFFFFLSRDVRKHTVWHGRTGETKFACAIVQSDWSLCCPHEETLPLRMSKMRPVKILIRLCEYAGWSESSLGAHVKKYVFWHCDTFDKWTCCTWHPTILTWFLR